jgi:uncharacterized protein YecE (DUF72 family)
LKGGKEWFIGTSGLMTSKSKWLANPELNLLEVNSTFYRLPGPKQIESWNAFPERVEFVFKMSKYVTHLKRLNDCKEAVDKFLSSLDGIKSRTKGFLVQLPPTFAYNTTNMARLEMLWQYMPKNLVDVFVEFRNPSWFNQEVYGFFKRKKWVIVGTWIKKQAGGNYMGNMPGGLYLPGPKTTDACYVRLHGSKGFRGSYSSNELEELRNKILSRDCKQNFVAFNNTFFANRSQSCVENGTEIKFAAVCNAIQLSKLNKV